MITVWGLKNCDTCKKARTWLEGKGATFAFKDVRADGLTADRITEWLAAVGRETLINKRGTTWRGLPPEVQAAAEDDDSAIALMQANPALIKRPIFEMADGEIVVGFAKKQQDAVEAGL
ncbi:Spx/MgsR family RNA polymerase-binding regulatory protein [Thalassobaculum sp. OXR-137]|uniref:Spx/MgsR family RNA polymerase-binding regulatory protein n=1 Tax=Thalassobaculum sp. OXR-137 TaxID=3100173 RepID=UPI002AC92246|nr:Spx/MgsR family RNA polymerase-binding regulatory protein [Thalassobaculum sp. OXR-137]WPZ34208.1 Spx/MgsR family RNA polymerase-binding regulatory protein [Thalassobaculum sp. OXR-137]